MYYLIFPHDPGKYPTVHWLTSSPKVLIFVHQLSSLAFKTTNLEHTSDQVLDMKHFQISCRTAA